VALQPAIINTVKADVTYRSLLASLQYAWEDSTIAQFQSDVIAEDNVQLIYATNFSRRRMASGLLALPLAVTGWWTTQNNLMVTWQEVDAFRSDEPFTLGRTDFSFNSTQNVSLPYDLDLEATGFYQSASLFGAIRTDAFWAVNLGLQRELPGGRGKVTFSVNDLFNSLEVTAKTGARDEPVYIEQVFDFGQRTFSLTYTTRFGDGKAAGRRSTASEEESGRVRQ
jgi:hypothetical protein